MAMGDWRSGFRLELLYCTLHELFRIVQVLEHERDVQLRLTWKAIAAAVDAMLADERHRVGEQIERDGEAAARRSHHRLVNLQRVAVLLERRFHLRGGFDGRSSTRLARLREFSRSRSRTTSATSSAEIFQSAPFCSSPVKPVATEPGIT